MMDIKTVRSAIYVSGNKYKLFDSISPHLKGRNILVDLFSGSGCVSLNVIHKELGFTNIITNERMQCIIGLHKCLQIDPEGFINDVINTNKLYDSTKKGYLELKDDYNKAPEIQPEKLYLLNCRSNSNMIRFNSSGEFNMTYGERNTLSVDRLHRHSLLCKGIDFHCEDYSTMIDKLYKMNYDFKDIVVYIDSPYSGTTATYNNSWTRQDDNLLLSRVVSLHKAGAKIVMSNVFENRGVVSQWLIDWCEEHKDLFEVFYMSISYGNSSFRKSNKPTKEVLIVSRCNEGEINGK